MVPASSSLSRCFCTGNRLVEWWNRSCAGRIMRWTADPAGIRHAPERHARPTSLNEFKMNVASRAHWARSLVQQNHAGQESTVLAEHMQNLNEHPKRAVLYMHPQKLVDIARTMWPNLMGECCQSRENLICGNYSTCNTDGIFWQTVIRHGSGCANPE